MAMMRSSAFEHELCMLARDGWQLRRALKPATELPLAGVLHVAMAPFTAWYVTEAANWLLQIVGDLDGAPLRDLARTMGALRVRAKLFDGDGLRETVSLFDKYEQRSEILFNQHHTGVKGFFARMIQCDLGLSFYGDDLVHTTHLGLAYSSVIRSDPDMSGDPFDEKAGQQLRAWGYSIGRFVGAITELLHKQHPMPEENCEPSELSKIELMIRDYDCKARKFYPALRRLLDFGEAHAAAFVWLVAQTNLVHRVLRAIFLGPGDFYFRTKFLSVYYILRGLKYIGAIEHARRSRIRDLVADLMARPEARSLRKASEPFRNAIAHYGIINVDVTRLSREKTMCDLIRALSPWEQTELETLLDRQLENMSLAFRSVMSPGNFASILHNPTEN